MITFYNDQHALHHGKVEMFRGELVPCFEVPARADFVLAELQKRKLGAIETPPGFADSAITRIHTQRYVIAEIGVNAVNVLDGFRQRTS